MVTAYAVLYTPLLHRASTTAMACTPDATRHSVLQRLQRVQIYAARCILNAQPRSPSLPLLHQLHWLPIESRIRYKLCSLIYRVDRNIAPSYLSELCVPCTDSRLRSTARGNYVVPRTQRRLANCAFAVAAPSRPHGIVCLTIFVTVKPTRTFHPN